MSPDAGRMVRFVAGLFVLAAVFAAGRYAAIRYAQDPAHMEAIAEHDYKLGDVKDAFPLFKSLAEKGDKTAAYYLGEMYQFGDGTKADGEKAVKWLGIAAKAGNAAAQRQLGLAYLDGVVTIQDFAEARKWLQAAADQGDPTALRSLGDMNHNGLGAPADPVAAYAYYSAASLRGNGYGSTMRDKVAASLDAAQQQDGQKKAREILARINESTPGHANPQPPKADGQKPAADSPSDGAKPS